MVRTSMLVRGGGLAGLNNYDDGVYYAAAMAWINGRAPYDQFVLLHPPGLLLPLAPFAWLGELTSDTTGLVAARLSFAALGGLNAVLISVLARRFSLVAGVTGGVLYALAFPAAYTERTISLEGWSMTLLLLSLLLLLRPGTTTSGRAALHGAGALLGFALATKVWNVVAVLVVVGWQCGTSGWRTATRLLTATALSATAVCIWFFVSAPEQMFRYVVSDQIARARSERTVMKRLEVTAGLQVGLPGLSLNTRRAVLIAVIVVVVLACLIVLNSGPRMVVPLLAAQVALILASPSFFPHYAEIVTAPAVLILAVAAGEVAVVLRSRSRWAAATAAVVAGITVAALTVEPAQHRVGQAFPHRFAAVAQAVDGCITADDPTTLALMNVLDRNFDAGCRVWVDVTGLTYDKASGAAPGQPQQRRSNRQWQALLMPYLLSGSATLITRPDTGLSTTSLRTIDHLPVITTIGQYSLRRVP